MAKTPFLVEKQPWMKLRKCTPEDAHLFFAFGEEDIQAAKEICKSCPVRTSCLDYAFAIQERHGVWGGMTYDERRKRKRRHANPAGA